MSKNKIGGRVSPTVEFRAFISKYIITGTDENYLNLYLTLAEKYGSTKAKRLIFRLLYNQLMANNLVIEAEKLLKIENNLSQNADLG